MSYRLRLADVRTQCARVLDLPPSDTRVAEYVSRAQQLLMNEGAWQGTTARFAVCVTESCLTWPREVETIMAWSVCNSPGTIRGRWYEFIGAGPGVLEEDDCNGKELIDRDEACSYDDPTGGTTKRYAIYTTVDETTTEKFIIQGYDINGQWVRTQEGGAWIDGEALALPAKGTYTYGTNSVAKAGLVRIIKPATNGKVYLYEYDNSDLTYKELGQYQPDEQVPIYRRSLIPGLVNAASGTNGSCSNIAVHIVASLRHIPVVNDNDFLIIGLPDALSLECQAIRKRENNLFEEATAYHAQAILLLEKQLSKFRGPGVIQPFQTEHPEVYGGGYANVQ